MIKTVLSVATLALLTVGCSSTRHCEREFPYQAAESAKPIEAVDGIAPPTSPAALRIPDVASENTQPYRIEEPDPDQPETKRVRCLDVPPPLPAQPDL